MIKPEQIPPAALEAGARAAHDQWRHQCAVEDDEPIEYFRQWPDLDEAERFGWIEQARAAFLAMLEAWPGLLPSPMAPLTMWDPYIILPLTEKTDDKA